MSGSFRTIAAMTKDMPSDQPLGTTPADPFILKPREGDPMVSIIAPAYNESELLEVFTDRTIAVMRSLKVPFEIVFVNDGSTDATLHAMHALRLRHSEIAVVNLSRNFGKEAAMTAGLAQARGDAVVIIDTDLQDPPELIPELVHGWIEGYDVVYAQRTEREGETWLKKKTADWFYRAIYRLGPVALPQNAGDFRLLSRRAVESLMGLPERHRFMKGLYSWIGFPQKAVPYRRHARFAGTTKWNYWKLWNLSIEGFTGYTIAPLKISTYLGLFVAVFSFLYGAKILLTTLIFGDPVAGFPTLMITVLFLGGLQLIVLGIIGEYLGRIFNETKQRPLFLIESVAPSLPHEFPSRQIEIDSQRPKALAPKQVSDKVGMAD